MTATIEETADAADDNAIWPVDLPPPLDDPGADEEISRLRTLEERIKHKYTPSKLAVDAIQAAPQPRTAAQTVVPQDSRSSNPSVKACPACAGVGKVYQPMAMDDALLQGKERCGSSL